MVQESKTVESISITVLVEGAAHPFLKGSRAPAAVRPLVGLSLYLEINSKEPYRLLMDTGTFWIKLRHNGEALGKDLAGIDCGVITHWHFDHSAALASLLKYMKRRPPFYVPVREPSFSLMNGFVEFRLPPDFNRVEVSGPREILPGVYSTGCMEGRFPMQRHAVHEQALYVNVRGRGLVLLVGCSHPKPQDLARQAIELSGERKIALMLGGFHFIPPTKEHEKDQIIKEMKKLTIDRIAACHCTGVAGMDRLQTEFRDQFVRVQLGAVYTVTAL